MSGDATTGAHRRETIRRKMGYMEVANEMKRMGVLYGGPYYIADGQIEMAPSHFNLRPVAQSQLPLNLGCCIKATELMSFERHFAALQPRGPENAARLTLTTRAA